MTQNINDFIANFNGGARPNKFIVTITWPALAGTPTVRDEFMVHSANLPSSVVTPVIVPYKGRQIPVPGDRIFEDWTITVMNDTTMSHRNCFTAWLNAINSMQGNLAASGTLSDLTTSVTVQQIDRDDTVLKTITLYNAFPTNMSQIDLGWDQNDVLELFTVTFSYSHWEDPLVPTT